MVVWNIINDWNAERFAEDVGDDRLVVVHVQGDGFDYRIRVIVILLSTLPDEFLGLQ